MTVGERYPEDGPGLLVPQRLGRRVGIAAVHAEPLGRWRAVRVVRLAHPRQVSRPETGQGDQFFARHNRVLVVSVDQHPAMEPDACAIRIRRWGGDERLGGASGPPSPSAPARPEAVSTRVAVAWSAGGHRRPSPDGCRAG
ncbi:hypothetical protein [Actinoplanes teichomyceticus]|uniref:hypothetical protein n=1 Tax=Actinoplanes teichomyceticus TaxID=1867 RepID=UPI001B85F65C|nr:hypothetical protein [Actinoplanes teichomyceticus]